jgi:antitoxin component of MazEF toxin-antitoxin module
MTEDYMTTITLRKQGNSIGVTFPADTRIRMGFEVGQDLTLVELADGVKLVKRNLVLERQMQLAREVLREQADTLQELAKR